MWRVSVDGEVWWHIEGVVCVMNSLYMCVHGYHTGGMGVDIIEGAWVWILYRGCGYRTGGMGVDIIQGTWVWISYRGHGCGYHTGGMGVDIIQGTWVWILYRGCGS